MALHGVLLSPHEGHDDRMSATTKLDASRRASLDGKYAIVTGATGGLGYQTALGLARQGATTILAGRNPAKGKEAVARIRREVSRRAGPV